MNTQFIGKPDDLENVFVFPIIKKGVCPTCASPHVSDCMHDAASVYYRIKFMKENGRMPTYKDAMAHCSAQMQDSLAFELKKYGITVNLDADPIEELYNQ